jgi:hypothetical protein
MTRPVESREHVIARTGAWVDRAVIGLNLCPFAKAPQAKGRIRYVVSEAVEPDRLLADLADELERLTDTSDSQIETTLLIHPHVLKDFAAFNDFIGVAEACVTALGLDGIVQLATFHPRYRFAETHDDDIENATNRSPYPILHLLRESSIDRAVIAYPDAAAIFEVNMETLRRLGSDGWARLEQSCRDDADATSDDKPSSVR